MNEEFVCYVLVFMTIFISIKIYYDSDLFQLTCIVSDVDGKKYCVRERKKFEKGEQFVSIYDTKYEQSCRIFT